VVGDDRGHRRGRLSRLHRLPARRPRGLRGRYFPDFQTVIDKINATDVAARWGQAFEGVITTITDAEGRNFKASELYHQD
jgi:hypothetical protein